MYLRLTSNIIVSTSSFISWSVMLCVPFCADSIIRSKNARRFFSPVNNLVLSSEFASLIITHEIVILILFMLLFGFYHSTSDFLKVANKIYHYVENHHVPIYIPSYLGVLTYRYHFHRWNPNHRGILWTQHQRRSCHLPVRCLLSPESILQGLEGGNPLLYSLGKWPFCFWWPIKQYLRGLRNQNKEI